MDRRRLGSKGPEISVVGFGTWEAGGDLWGEEVAERDVTRAIEAGLDADIDWMTPRRRTATDGPRSWWARSSFAGRTRWCSPRWHFASGARAQDVNRAIRGRCAGSAATTSTCIRSSGRGSTTCRSRRRGRAMAQLQDKDSRGSSAWRTSTGPLIERCLAIGHVDSVQNQFPPHAGRPHRAPAVAPGARHRLSGVRPARLRFAHGHFDRDTTFHEADWRSGAENLGYSEELFPPGRFEDHFGNIDPLRPIAERVHMDLPTLALRTAIDTPASRRSSRGAARRPTRDPTARPEPCISTRRRCATSMTSSGLDHLGDRDRAA